MPNSKQESNSSVQLDPSDPLFLSSSDHPGLTLVSKAFDGNSFGAWKKSMSIALSAKNKLGFITGKVVKPDETSSDFNQWQRCNDMVTSWILNVLSSDIAESILFSDSAYDIWKELEDLFDQANGAKLYQLKKDMCSFAQGTRDVATYFTKMKKIWDELNTLNVFPKCTCGAAKSIAKFEQDQRLVQFLMGLNSDYNTVR